MSISSIIFLLLALAILRGGRGNVEITAPVTNTPSTGISTSITPTPSEKNLETIKIQLGKTKSALGVFITPERILEDSRCPVDVQCIQAGQVRLSATIKSKAKASKIEFKSDAKVTFENFEITLVDVKPVTHSGKKIASKDYIFTFAIKKK